MKIGGLNVTHKFIIMAGMNQNVITWSGFPLSRGEAIFQLMQAAH